MGHIFNLAGLGRELRSRDLSFTKSPFLGPGLRGTRHRQDDLSALQNPSDLDRLDTTKDTTVQVPSTHIHTLSIGSAKHECNMRPQASGPEIWKTLGTEPGIMEPYM